MTLLRQICHKSDKNFQVLQWNHKEMIHPQSNNFVRGVRIKAAGDLELDDSPKNNSSNNKNLSICYDTFCLATNFPLHYLRKQMSTTGKQL